MRLRLALAMLALLLAGCGTSSRTATTRIPQVEQEVTRVLERGLMTSQPRTQEGSTHVRRVHCTTRSANTFSCEVTLRDGSRRRVTAQERRDGEVVVR